jgi:hypothetical protein
VFHFPLRKVNNPGESAMTSYFLSKVGKVYSLRQGFSIVNVNLSVFPSQTEGQTSIC